MSVVVIIYFIVGGVELSVKAGVAVIVGERGVAVVVVLMMLL